MYEVSSNYGSTLFSNIKDAISALELLASYHSLEINRRLVERYLEDEGSFEAFPLSISLIM